MLNSERRYLLPFVLTILLTLPFLWRGLYESSEGRYAQIANTMNQTQDYWMPKLNGHSHLTKPPLTYWTIALGMKAFGKNNFGARFMHALAWILLSLIVVRVGELLFDQRTGLLAGLIFTTSLLPALGSSALTTDPLVVLFQGMSLWGFIEYSKNPYKLWSILFWVSLGLAFNTKGPVALLPVLFFVFFYKKTFMQLIRTNYWPIMIVVGCFWYIGLEIKESGLLWHLFQEEIIKRSTTDFSGRNAFWWTPLPLYFLPLLLGWGPWPILLRKNVFSHLSREQKFLLTWVVVSLIFFSLVQSRLILYILPLSVPASLLLGSMINTDQKFKTVLLVNVAMVLIIKTYFSFFYYHDSNAEKIAEFVEGKTSEEVYFLDEYLYGAEFYLDKRFKRLANYNEIHSAFLDGRPLKWVFFREKNEKFLIPIATANHKKIHVVGKMGKWVMAEMQDYEVTKARPEKH